MDGREKMGGREKGVMAVGTVLRWRGTMAGDEELAGALSSGAMGHGSTNRRHQGIEGVQATSPRPRMRPKDTADAVVAMADGENPTGVHGWALEAMIHEFKGTGRRRGTRGSHHR